MWHAGKDQDKTLVVAVVESWDWIHYLVEPNVVEFEFRGKENDSACANAISNSNDDEYALKWSASIIRNQEVL